MGFKLVLHVTTLNHQQRVQPYSARSISCTSCMIVAGSALLPARDAENFCVPSVRDSEPLESRS